LVEVVGYADIPAVVLAFEYIDKGTEYDGFKHITLTYYQYIKVMDLPPVRELTPAERHYEKHKERVRALYRKKHPEIKRKRNPVPPPNASIQV
jgi:hypothetical protein